MFRLTAAKWLLALTLGLAVAIPVLPAPMPVETAVAADRPTAPSGARKFVYKPPLRGAPSRRIGGATRSDGSEQLYVAVLAPEGTALSSVTSPTLYWYASQTTERQALFTLIRDDKIDPTAEVKLPKLSLPGSSKVSLADLNIRLEPGIVYEWSIALVKDPRSRSTDIVTSATILHRPPTDAAAGKLKSGNAEERFLAFSEGGFWYDAIALAADAGANSSNKDLWRDYRASLLAQAGLGRIAEGTR